MMTKHEPLEELENLVKSHFGDLLVSVAVSAHGTLFLSIWQQPSTKSAAYMNYLPLFYIVGGMDERSKLFLKLITFHGKVLDNLIEQELPLLDDEKVAFIDKLTRIQLCHGVQTPDNELKLDPQTFSYLYLVEHVENNVIVRSRQCQFGLFGGIEVCKACIALNKDPLIKESNLGNLGDSSPCKRKRGRPRTSLVDEGNADPLIEESNGLILENVKLETEYKDEFRHSFEAFNNNKDAPNNSIEPNANNQNETDDRHLYETSNGNMKPGSLNSGSNSNQLEQDLLSKTDISALSIKHKPFMCDECGKTFTSAAKLRIHLEDLFHRSKITAVCFECGDTFENRLNLRRHLWSHKNLKPYKCKDCEFTSTTKEHVFSQHAVHAHGKSGCIDDVIVLMDVMVKIDEFEKSNRLELGPSMSKEKKCESSIDRNDTPNKNSNSKKTKPNRLKEGLIHESDIKQELDEFTGESFENDGIEPLSKRGRPGKFSTFDVKPKGLSKQKFKEECSICLNVFNNKEEYDNDQTKHKQQLSNQEMVQCPTCAVSIIKVDINYHYLNDHPELKAGCCIDCNTIIAPRSKMSKHMAAVHKPKNDLCPICGKNFRNVRDHVAVKHGNKERNHVCDSCGKKFTHPLLLSAHISKIHSVRKQLPCKFCGQIFMEKNPLRFHYWAIHLKVKPYKCKHCHYCGTQPQKIYEHCRSVHKFPGGKKDVEHVEEEFARIREFETQHGLNRQEFKASREFLCWLCKKNCQSNQGLLKHEFSHLDLSPFECKQCGMKFKMKVLLQSHLDKRHNEKISATIIEGNPEIMGLYERVRKLSTNSIDTYNKYKDSDSSMDEKTGEKRLVMCKKCQITGLNYAEFLDHFHKTHGNLFNHLQQETNDVTQPDAKQDCSEMLRCKCCGFETLIPEVLQKHIAEVHRFTPEMYDQFIEAPKVEPTQKMYRPRKYRCRYCLVYTAVKKFTVHRHIRNTHGVQETFEHDILLISESEHLLHSTS